MGKKRIGRYAPKSKTSEINKFRVKNGLRPLKPDRIPCSHCGALFDSYDTTTEKMCPLCRHESVGPLDYIGSTGIRVKTTRDVG